MTSDDLASVQNYRPRNKFIIARCVLSKLLKNESGLSNNDISKIVSYLWSCAAKTFKQYFEYLAFFENQWYEMNCQTDPLKMEIKKNSGQSNKTINNRSPIKNKAINYIDSNKLPDASKFDLLLASEYLSACASSFDLAFTSSNSQPLQIGQSEYTTSAKKLSAYSKPALHRIGKPVRKSTCMKQSQNKKKLQYIPYTAKFKSFEKQTVKGKKEILLAQKRQAVSTIKQSMVCGPQNASANLQFYEAIDNYATPPKKVSVLAKHKSACETSMDFHNEHIFLIFDSPEISGYYSDYLLALETGTSNYSSNAMRSNTDYQAQEGRWLHDSNLENLDMSALSYVPTIDTLSPLEDANWDNLYKA